MLPSANPADDRNVLHGVAVVSASDAWAVGNYDMFSRPFQTLAEHWDGTRWAVSPTPAIDQSDLEAVAAVSSRDVWAVGAHTETPSTTVGTLTEHWDGAQWSIVPSPSSGIGSQLVGVVALASNDVWAVGQVYSGNSNIAQLIEHWNGTQWSTTTVPTLAPNTPSTLEGIAAVSASDIWAVGFTYSTVASPGLPLIEHWNGTQWSIVPGATVAAGSLMAVAAVSSNNVWAVGGQSAPSSSSEQTLVEHWNGARWSIVASPNPGPSGNVSGNAYLSVTTSSRGDVWAAGVEMDNAAVTGAFDVGLGFFTHWTGQRWDVTAAPAQPHNWRIWHMATGPAGDVWAVGSVDTLAVTTGSTGTLIEHLG